MSRGFLTAWRVRLLAWSAALVALAFAQAPGQTAGDTKLDLVVDPGAFLARALHLWDPSGAAGQVQNQAYGYLFPMGPFFWLGDLAGLPPWVVQRLWWALVLVVAFLGVVKLLGALEVGVPWTRVLAGLAYALSPRLLTVIGASSIEVWPAALAPWVLVPLVIGARRGDPRRAALLSAVAVACVGGVNAAATFAVVPMAVWFLWTTPPGPRRRAMRLWWPPAVLLATAWWLGPLFLLGRYSPPFLDYIESISNTSFAATTADALRGTTNWVAYVDPTSVAGQSFLGNRVLALNVAVVVVLGLLGLARADLPARRLVLPPLLVGLVAVTAGHLGSTTGVGAHELRHLLDGPLAPLRNTHKFDVLVRLPLVIGLCHACTVLTREKVVGKVTAVAMTVVSVLGVVGAAAPAWSGQVAPRGTFAGVPGYWGDAADWLEAHANGRTLLTPASTFGRYVWGRTNDEPLQALMSTPWAVRNVIPLVPGADIDALDTVSRALQQGQGSAALATFLRRSGVGTIVVRHDLDQAQVDVESPETVRDTLLTTPGLRLVASFGPQVGGPPTFTTLGGREVLADVGRRAERPAIEVFSFARTVAPQVVETDPATVVGDSDSLLRLDDTGVTSGGSSVLAPDVTGRPTGPLYLTDGNRRQEAVFSQVRHNRSATLTADEPYTVDRAVHRYDETRLRRWTTVARLDGARALTASSSRADAGSSPRLEPDASPWAAFDGDPDTAWKPDQDQGPTAWIDLDLGRPRDVGRVTVTVPLDDELGRSVRVLTQEGWRTVPVVDRRASVEVGTVRHVRIEARRSAERELAVSDVAMQHVGVTRPLVLPTVPRSWGVPAAVLLQAQTGASGGCVDVDGVARCADSFVERTEDGRVLDRVVTMPAAASYTPRLRVVAQGGRALDALLQRGRLATVEVSSQSSASARGGALATVDGSSTSGWTASRDDLDPTLTVRWVKPRRIQELRLASAASFAGTPPTSVRLDFSDGSHQTVPVVRGRVRFTPVRSTFVAIHLVVGRPRLSVDFGGFAVGLPAGVGEVRVPGISGFTRLDSDESVVVGCAAGPTLEVDGRSRRASVRTSVAGLVSGRPVTTRWCDGADEEPLVEGENRVLARGTDALRPEDVVLAGSAPSTSGRSVVRTGHNENIGWRGRADGRSLSPVVLNGWQQGWRVPTGFRGDVRETFAPGTPYRVALGVGALALVLLLLLALLVRGREPEAVPDTRRGRFGTPVLLGSTLVAASVVAGLPAVGVVVATLVLVAVLQRRWSPAAVVVAGVAGAGATLPYVVWPWVGPQPWAGDLVAPQLLAWVAVSAVVVAEARPRGRRSLSRSAGRSTSR